MMGHNICFKGVIWKIIPNPFYPFLSGALNIVIITYYFHLTSVVLVIL